MKKLNDLPVGKRIAFGFLLNLIFFTTAIVATVYYVKKVSSINSRLVELRIPTARATSDAINGINHSLAALRGWIILGKDKMKKERSIAWKQIDESMTNMTKFSKSWTNPENIKKLDLIKKQLELFRKDQKDIEEIAHSQDNLPANKILFVEAAPKAAIMLKSITNLINIELQRRPGHDEYGRKQFLGILADIRGTTARGLANIRAFLLSGNKKFENNFHKMWNKNIKKFSDLGKNQWYMNREQKVAYRQYASAREKFKNLPSKMFKIRNGQEWNMANTWLGRRAAPKAAMLLKNLKEMSVNQNKLMVTDGDIAKGSVSMLLNIEYFLLLIGIICIGILGTVIYKGINSGLLSITDKINSEIVDITTIAGKLSDYSLRLSSASTEQASAAQETMSSMDEIDAMVKRNADNAKESEKVSSQGLNHVKKGSDDIKRMVVSIQDISRNNDEVTNEIKNSNEEMKRIANVIAEIGEKTKVINDIVFQTKLLSFNASVEAARAGEHGKGFSVVAEEVGNLASMSGKAASEITNMLDSSIKSVEEQTQRQKEKMDELVNKSSAKIQDGLEIGKLCEKSLRELLDDIGNLSKSVTSIAKASEEQSKGVREISAAVGEISSATNSNAEISRNTTEVSSNLNSGLENFQGIIGSLMKMVGKATDDE